MRITYIFYIIIAFVNAQFTATLEFLDACKIECSFSHSSFMTSSSKMENPKTSVHGGVSSKLEIDSNQLMPGIGEYGG